MLNDYWAYRHTRIMHSNGIAAAAYSCRTKSSAKSPMLLHHTHCSKTAAHRYFAPLYRDQRPAIHGTCSAVHYVYSVHAHRSAVPNRWVFRGGNSGQAGNFQKFRTAIIIELGSQVGFFKLSLQAHSLSKMLHFYVNIFNFYCYFHS